MTRDDTFSGANDHLVGKGPCPGPNCGSSDGFASYLDGHGYCFVCGHREPASEERAKKTGGKSQRPTSGLLLPQDYTELAGNLKQRQLDGKTLKRFGYFLARYSGQVVHVAPYFAMTGELVCQKLRFPNKDFVVLKAEDAPHINECQLFGKPVWGDKNDKRVVIHEGELDAMSSAQATEFDYPCVSVASGAKGAAKSVKANYLWLDRFKEIVLWFDDDEHGHKARDEVAPLFKVGKVKVAKA